MADSIARMSEKKEKIVPSEVLRQLTVKSDLKGLLQLVAHLLVILLTGSGIALADQTVWIIPALITHGIALIFVFAPLHETIHYTAFKSKWLNNTVAAVFGFILLLPYQYFRTYHYVHHRHTQDPDKDPELIDKKAYTKSSLLFYLSGIPTWRWHLRMLWEHVNGRVSEPYIEDRAHTTIINEARIHVAFYGFLFVASLLMANSGLFWYWILPVIIGQPFLRLYLMAEHNDCDFSDNMLENSRTTYTSPVINFLAWNMPYHAEHHYLAAVPFHALPKLHAYTGQSVKHQGDGYWQVLRDLTRRITTSN